MEGGTSEGDVEGIKDCRVGEMDRPRRMAWCDEVMIASLDAKS